MAETHRIGCCMKKYNNNLGNLATKHSETCLENAPRLLNKKTPTHVFSCEFCKNFQNTRFTEHLRVAASGDTNFSRFVRKRFI